MLVRSSPWGEVSPLSALLASKMNHGPGAAEDGLFDLSVSEFGFEESDDPYQPLGRDQILSEFTLVSEVPILDFSLASEITVDLSIPCVAREVDDSRADSQRLGAGFRREASFGQNSREVQSEGRRRGSAAFLQDEFSRRSIRRQFCQLNLSEELCKLLRGATEQFPGLSAVPQLGRQESSRSALVRSRSRLLFDKALELFSIRMCVEGARAPRGEERYWMGSAAPPLTFLTPGHLLSGALHSFACPSSFVPHSQAAGSLLLRQFYSDARGRLGHAGVSAGTDKALSEEAQSSPAAAATLQRIASYREALGYCFSKLYPWMESAGTPKSAQARKRENQRSAQPKKVKRDPRYRQKRAPLLLGVSFTDSLSSEESSGASAFSSSWEYDDLMAMEGEDVGTGHVINRNWLLHALYSQFVVSLQASYQFLFLKPGRAFGWAADPSVESTPLAILCCHPRVYESVLLQLAEAGVPEAGYLVYRNGDTKQETIVLRCAEALRWAHHWLAQAASLYVQGEVDVCDVPRVSAHFPFPGASLVRTGYVSWCSGAAEERRSGAERQGRQDCQKDKSATFRLQGEFTSLQKLLLQASIASGGAGASILFKPTDFTEDCNDALAEWMRESAAAEKPSVVLSSSPPSPRGSGPAETASLARSATQEGYGLSWAALRVFGAGERKAELRVVPKMYVVQAWESGERGENGGGEGDGAGRTGGGGSLGNAKGKRNAEGQGVVDGPRGVSQFPAGNDNLDEGVFSSDSKSEGSRQAVPGAGAPRFHYQRKPCVEF